MGIEMKLYHGTDKENLRGIKTNGLVASIPKDVNFNLLPERGGSHAAVSLAKTMATAVCYGNAVLVVELPDDTETTKIDLFNEVLVNGNIAPAFITNVYLISESTWIEEVQLNENHIEVGPVKRSEGYVHVVELTEVGQ